MRDLARDRVSSSGDIVSCLNDATSAPKGEWQETWIFTRASPVFDCSPLPVSGGVNNFVKDDYFSITARVCSSIAQVHLSYFFLSYPRVLYHIGMEALDNNFNITYATLIFSPPQAENFRSSYLLNADFLS